MDLGPRLTAYAIARPKFVIGTLLAITALFAAQFPNIRIDTDPENMLEPEQPDRVRYDRLKETFGIRDLVVVGIVDDAGVFRTESLEAVAAATDAILRIPGVVIPDVVSLTTTDNVRSAGGVLDIRPVMEAVPRTAEEIASLRRQIAENPFLHEKIASADGTAVALYIPIESKDISHRVAGEVEAILRRELAPGQSYHIAGLPVAEDTFGHEMFLQMGVTAPLAFMGILLLIFLLFRRAAFLVPVGMDAMLSVIWAMGLLIGTGQTVHIMSSMIPVFLMPIAILDDVHVLSAFFDAYPEAGDKRTALLTAMRPLYRPMLYTSLTSAVGFASLALADIPPVRVFGLFVAFGILVAWLLSMTMVPAVISLMSEDRLQRMLQTARGGSSPRLDAVLQRIGGLTFSRPRQVLAAGLVVVALGVAGVAQVEINDNPVKWFKKGHRIRVADELMNRLFGGTYMAYLLVEGETPGALKRPEVLSYVDRLQAYLEDDPLVGKTSSVADIVKRVNLVLHDNDPAFDRVPESAGAIGQFLFLYESAGDPNDLDNFVDREASSANIWVQMKGGDNKQMEAVERRLDDFVAANPLPEGVRLRWSGLTYINKVWQDLMVFGMLKAVLGSFLVVFLLMLAEFRSPALGALSMVPLSVAMLLSYGLVGWTGKDYDMPIAVCSALSLGLAIDFAIHYLQRFKSHYSDDDSLQLTHRRMFGEPVRAIARNAIVISLGFLPLMASTLTPYVTVGAFFALLMVFSALSTLFLLPAAMRLVGPKILRAGKAARVAAAVALLTLAPATIARALAAPQELTGAEIIKRSQEAYYYAGDDMRARVSMELIDAHGRTRARVLTMLRWDAPSGGNQRYFVYFHEPGDVRGMTFMVWKYPQREDDRWIYLPAVDLLRRVAADDKRSSFVGSDFTYEDVSGRDVGADAHRLLRTEEIDGRRCFVIQSVPHEPVEYVRRLSWIDVETFLPLREEYFDAQNELYRVFTADRIEAVTVEGDAGLPAYPTVMERTMANVKTGHRTRVTFTDVAYDVGLRPEDFSERSMRRPPRRWIR